MRCMALLSRNTRAGCRPVARFATAAFLLRRLFRLQHLVAALGTGILSLDPTFPLKYMILFLIVISVGGTTTITGPFFASILLGVADVAGKYFIPSAGGFIIYTIMVLVLIVRPQGLFVRGASR